MKPALPSLVILALALFFSCKTDRSDMGQISVSASDKSKGTTSIKPPPAKNEIFYGLLTPVEMCSIFNRLNVPYNEGILNPVMNKDHYLSSAKIAVNAGIYCVDLGYLKSFGSDQQLLNYLLVVRDICLKLGLPESDVTDPFNRLEKDLADRDTIMAVMNRAFTRIENHLKEERRGGSGGLIVMGGWVEAMYIASQLLYNPAIPDPEVVERIASQKYTLASLISFMKNYYEDPVDLYYIRKLKYLYNYFDSFEIFYKKGDLEIDTAKKVLLSSVAEINVTVGTLNRITEYVKKLRTEMVTP
jgi:hypothetical protein